MQVREESSDAPRGWSGLKIIAGIGGLAFCVALILAWQAAKGAGMVAPTRLAEVVTALATQTPTYGAGSPGSTGGILPSMPLCKLPTEPVAEESPLPQPSAAPPTPEGVFGLAWFHKPPEDGTTPQEMAEAHRYIHLTGPADIPYREKLRAAGYKGPVLNYVTAASVEGPGPYENASASCAPGYKPYDNNVALERDDFCNYIHGNESWFLHNSKGERLVEDYFGTGRWSYLMNPADKDWQAFSHERLRRTRDLWGYDGLWLDNLDLDLQRALTDSSNRDGRVSEYATDEEWRRATVGWLEGLRAELGDFPIWANLVGGGLSADSWDAYAPYLDGAMDETFSVRWLDGWRNTDDWASQVERAERWLDSGKELVMVGQGAQNDTGRLHFTLASFMLVANGEASYRYTRFDTYYNSLWLYEEFGTACDLGAPIGPRRETSPGVWRRDFAEGYVEVDVAAHEGRLVLGKE